MNEKEFAAVREIVEDKYDLWLGSVDALADERRGENATKVVQRLVGAERHDWAIMKDAMGLLRNAILASTVPMSVAESTR